MQHKKYRNLVSVTSNQGVEIDPGALWEWDSEQSLLVLVDDDDYQTHAMSEAFESNAEDNI